MTTTPHKHAEIIKAWAEGHQIQWQDCKQLWHDVKKPDWDVHTNYRVKPAEPEKSYPVTQMKMEDFNAALRRADAREGLALHVAGEIANAALRHAIDSGQVVAIEDVDTDFKELKLPTGPVKRESSLGAQYWAMIDTNEPVAGLSAVDLYAAFDRAHKRYRALGDEIARRAVDGIATRN